jgi:hypothetical protein
MACENCRSVELLSNEELIQELMSRTTFLGIIIFSQDPVKGDGIHRNFNVVCPDIDTNSVQRLMLAAIQSLKEAA